jgi:hypothetical protein
MAGALTTCRDQASMDRGAVVHGCRNLTGRHSCFHERDTALTSGARHPRFYSNSTIFPVCRLVRKSRCASAIAARG